MKKLIVFFCFLVGMSISWYVYAHIFNSQIVPRFNWNMDEQANSSVIQMHPEHIIATGLDEQICTDDGDAKAFSRDSSYFLSGTSGGEGTNSLPQELGVISRQKEIFSLGRTNYLAHCTVCHGINGDGKGPMSQYADYPQVGDFRSADYVNMSAGRMFRSIRAGQGNMPAFGNKLTAKEIWSIVYFIRQFAMEPTQSK